MKRLLIFLMLFAAIAVGALLSPIAENPVVLAQTNTFCAANLTCTVTAGWTFSSTLTASGTTTLTGRTNCKQFSTSVYCVDTANSQGWAGAEPGAWINAADAALTAAQGSNIHGTIMVLGQLPATTQITVGVRHELDVRGALEIANPLLMSDGAVLDCHNQRGSGGASTVFSGLIATANMTQMVRGLTQDGTTEMFTVRNCGLDGGFNTITTGLIDTSGMNDRTLIAFNQGIHFNGGFCWYTTNALANSTSNQTWIGNWCSADGSVANHASACRFLGVPAASTNQGSIIGNAFYSDECSTGSSTQTQLILIQNAGTAPANSIMNNVFYDLSIFGTSGGNVTHGVFVDKAWNTTFNDTRVGEGAITMTNGITVSSNANNVGNIARNTKWGLGANITNLINDGLNTVTLPVAGGHTVVEEYPFINTASASAIQTSLQGITTLNPISSSGANLGSSALPFGFLFLGGTIRSAGSNAIMGLTLKKGSGAGNYTTASTTYVVVDSTNLCFTAVIPTGWKLGVSASGALGTATAAVLSNIALTDNAACTTANAGALVETTQTTGAAGVFNPWSLNYVVTGDGASHNIALQFKTSAAADVATLLNANATQLPTMMFTLVPSN